MAPRARTVYLLDLLFFWWSPLNQYLLPERTAVFVLFEFINFPCVCMSPHYWALLAAIYEIWKLNGSHNLVELSADPLVQWTLCKPQHFSVFLCPRLNCLANCQTTYKENYGPWGVLGKLHHWQFYLGELQGLDNAPLKYDDRLEGMYPGPFYKLHKTLIAEN